MSQTPKATRTPKPKAKWAQKVQTLKAQLRLAEQGAKDEQKLLALTSKKAIEKKTEAKSKTAPAKRKATGKSSPSLDAKVEALEKLVVQLAKKNVKPDTSLDI